jgi:hypothetical protein
MNDKDIVQLLWFVKKSREIEDELLIGVYSSEADARAAIQRLQNKPGFAEIPWGVRDSSLRIGPRSLDGGLRSGLSLYGGR